MKKITKILLLAILFTNSCFAQIKKSIPKKKPTITTISSNRIDFFAKTPDELTEILNDEFKKQNISLIEITDTPTYAYDAVGAKINSIFENLKTLNFNKGLYIYINSDEKDQIIQVSFITTANNSATYLSILKMINLDSFSKISETDENKMFLKNDVLINHGIRSNSQNEPEDTNKTYYVSIQKIAPYLYQPTKQSAFDINDIKVNSNVDDLGYAIVELLKGSGTNLLYKSQNRPNVSFDGLNLYSYNCRYNFANLITVDIQTNKSHMLSKISFSAPDPILFSKLKKLFNFAQWENKGKNQESNFENYKLNNINCTVYSSNKEIDLKINPIASDTKSRLDNTTTPSFQDLTTLYKSGNSDDVAKNLSEMYVTKVKLDENRNVLMVDNTTSEFNFYFKSPNGLITRGYFNYDVSLKNSLEIYVESNDIKYMRNLFSEYKTGSSRLNYQVQKQNNQGKVVDSDDFTAIYFMNSALRNEQNAAAEEKNRLQQEEIEQERIRKIEQERQRRIDDEAERVRKVQKAEADAKALNGMVNDLINMYKK